jgi:hypothetical protein
MDPEACRRFVLSRIHPGGIRCPGCREVIPDGPKRIRLMAGGRVLCSGGRRFTAVTGTALAGSHMDDRTTVLLAFLAGEGIRPGRIAEITGLDRSTVRTWIERLEGILT